MRRGPAAAAAAGRHRADRLERQVDAVPGRARRAGHAPEAIARITCPIGQPGITGKDPAVIAVAVAAALLAVLPASQRPPATTGLTSDGGAGKGVASRAPGGEWGKQVT